MTRPELLARAALIVLSLAATATAAPPALSAPLALLSLVNSGQMVARLVPGRDPIERVLAGTGGVAVMLILLGLVLNYAPGGITRPSYAAGWAAISSALLFVVCTRQRAADADLTRARAARTGGGGVQISAATLATTLSFGLLATATAVALQVGSAGIRKQGQQPVLALSSPEYGGSEAEILVSSVNAGGAYQLLALPDGRMSGAYAWPLQLAVKRAHSAELRVELPRARCYWRVLLRPYGSQAAERELILWTGTSSAGLQRRRASVTPLAGRGPGSVGTSRACGSARTPAR